jgi:hypothetical protein
MHPKPALFILILSFTMGCAWWRSGRGSRSTGGSESSEIPAWRVFEPVRPEPRRAGEKDDLDPGFENGSEKGAPGWAPFGEGYEIDPTGGRRRGRAVRLANPAPGAARGVLGTVVLDQKEPRPIYLSAASRAEKVTGEPDADYSLYLDLLHVDGTSSYGHTLEFATGTHDWEVRQRVLSPSKAVAKAFVHCLFRNKHAGVVWFDDVLVTEAPAAALIFDSQLVTAVADAPVAGPPRAPVATLATGDGLKLELGEGGAVTSVALSGKEVGDPARARRGGFLLRDVRGRSDWIHPGGRLREEGDRVEQAGDLGTLGLRFSARYAARGDRIDVHAEIEDTRGEPRAVTLGFALPLSFSGWTWGDHLRGERVITGQSELSNTSREWDIGAVGSLSRYPWAAVWGREGGIALAHGLLEPRVVRFAANPATGQLTVVFDLGLHPDTARFPGRAWVDFSLYRFDPAWGFRSAAQAYYDRHAALFTRRMRPEREGIWLPFTKKSHITGIADFGFGVHELHELTEVASNQELGISSFRYLQVPDSYTLDLDGKPAPARDAALEERVMAALRTQHQRGEPVKRAQAEAIYSSAFHDSQGRFLYRWAPVGEIPWCGGSAGCALFPVSSDPDIADRQYPINKARADWNDQTRQLHARLPELTGEFVDGVQATTFRFLIDHRRSHLQGTRQPPSFMGEGRVVGIPSLFATINFLHWLEPDVHTRMGKLLMGNTVPDGLPWGADVFDYLGTEANWMVEDRFVPDDDATMSYRRTLSHQRPFGLLQNSDFVALGREGRVERYFQIALFYGFYPSFFSADASSNPYWEDPALYNRDRALFRKYVPIVRRLSQAGWEVITRAWTSDRNLHIERFGRPGDLFFTLHNTTASPVTVTVRLDPALGLAASPLRARRLIATGPEIPVASGEHRTFSLPLAAGAVEAVEVLESSGSPR